MLRNNFINKYLNEKMIVLDRISTYPEHVKNLIAKNLDLIKSFTKNQTQKSNRFYQPFYKLMDDIRTYLVLNKYEVLSFHATNLLSEEVEDIKNNGLKLFNEDSYLKKLSILKQYGFLQEDIDEIIKLSKLYKSGRVDNYRLNHTSYFHSIDKLILTDDFVPFLECWGGEITNMSINRFPNNLKEKFSKLGKPYIIVNTVRVENLSMFKELLRNLCINYCSGLDEMFDTDTSIDKKSRFLDIIELDRDYKTIIK